MPKWGVLKWGVECPWGFTMWTSQGEDDAVAVVQLHLNGVHPQMNPSRAEALKNIKRR